jgi:hypothetical protein
LAIDIVFSVLLRFAASNYPFGFCKLLLVASYAGAAGMLLHINGKFIMGKLK